MNNEKALELKRNRDELMARYINITVERASISDDLVKTCISLAAGGGYVRPDRIGLDRRVDVIEENVIEGVITRRDRLAEDEIAVRQLALDMVDELHGSGHANPVELEIKACLTNQILRGIGCRNEFLKAFDSAALDSINQAWEMEDDHE